MPTRSSLKMALSMALGLVPAGLAAAWIPLRTDLPSTDAALMLVVGVVAVSFAGGKATALVGSLAAVTGFDLFDTPPYGQLLMTRSRDVVTAVFLLLAGLLVGSLAVSVRSYRRVSARREEDFTVMASAARLVSVGESAGVVVSALAGELITRLDLRECEFVYGAPGEDVPWIHRDGTLSGPPDRSCHEMALPVWTADSVRGYFRLTLKGSAVPTPDRLLAAVGIGEQAGAALTTQLVDPGPDGGPRVGPHARPAPGADVPSRSRRLRLVR